MNTFLSFLQLPLIVCIVIQIVSVVVLIAMIMEFRHIHRKRMALLHQIGSADVHTMHVRSSVLIALYSVVTLSCVAGTSLLLFTYL